jgi:nucleotide-binding universal stress UspA family protein
MEPMRIERIVAAVDFSAWTPAVLQAAGWLARAYSAAVTAVHAEMFLPPPYFTERGTQAIREVLAAQKDAAREYLRDTASRHLGVGVAMETRLVEASPVAGVLGTANELGAGMIVLGTHGRSGLNRLLLGSVAENILRQSRLPVLSVRQQTWGAPGRSAVARILCPVNYTPVAMAALNCAADLARRVGAELVVVTAVDADADGASALPDRPDAVCAALPADMQQHCALRAIVRHGTAAEQIVQAAADEACDLLVMGVQHRRLLEATTLGTTSVRVMRHAPVPVLAVTRAAANTTG